MHEENRVDPIIPITRKNNVDGTEQNNRKSPKLPNNELVRGRNL